MKLTKITKKQQAIIELLYKHRFLNRIQIQALMGHKDYKTINVWLKDLREKQYLEWIYSTDFTEKTKPAIYYLGINGIRLLKEVSGHPAEELRKRYRESSRSQSFIDTGILLGDCCIDLERQHAKQIDETVYYYELEPQYSGGYYEFITESELIKPKLCFCKDKYDPELSDYVTVQSYLLEVFEATLPRYRVRKRLKNYLEYLDDNDWEDQTQDSKNPAALFICQTKADLIYCKRATKRLLEDAWDPDDIHMRFTTVDKLKQHGVTGKIWEEVRAPEE